MRTPSSAVAGPGHQYIRTPVRGPGDDVGISCDWLWFHSWMELGFTSCRVSISVQGLSTSSPVGCETPAAHSGLLPREAAGSCAHPR